MPKPKIADFLPAMTQGGPLPNVNLQFSALIEVEGAGNVLYITAGPDGERYWVPFALEREGKLRLIWGEADFPVPAPLAEALPHLQEFDRNPNLAFLWGAESEVTPKERRGGYVTGGKRKRKGAVVADDAAGEEG